MALRSLLTLLILSPVLFLITACTPAVDTSGVKPGEFSFTVSGDETYNVASKGYTAYSSDVKQTGIILIDLNQAKTNKVEEVRLWLPEGKGAGSYEVKSRDTSDISLIFMIHDPAHVGFDPTTDTNYWMETGKIVISSTSPYTGSFDVEATTFGARKVSVKGVFNQISATMAFP
jgi:hypothetical protein